MTTQQQQNEAQIEVVLNSANGPKVIVSDNYDAEDIEAALPDGWTVGDNWHNGVKLGDGRWSYPLVAAMPKSVLTITVRNSQGASEQHQADTVNELIEWLDATWSDPENLSASIADKDKLILVKDRDSTTWRKPRNGEA